MKNRIWWLIAAGVILMGLGMLGSEAFLTAGRVESPGADLIRVTAQANAAGDGGKLSEDDVAAMQAAMEGSKLSWWANGRGTVGTDGRSTQADVYAVTGAFQDFHRIDMLYGSFLPRTEAGGMAAVLDSDLAYRIFGTENAVGMEVEYQGKTFQVCGVCKTDTSLIGLMSGNGLYRAYVSGYDLVSTGKLAIGGFEASLPHGAPGVSLSAVQAALQTQGKQSGSFLIEDRTEALSLDAEIAKLPAVLLWVSAALLLLAFAIGAMRGIFREALALLRGDYLRRVWGALAWRLAKFLLVLAAGAGLCAVMWYGIGLRFDLPAKYIPGSWIDPAFYTGLIKSETQAAIAAQAYPKMWWDLSYSAAVRLSRSLDALAVLGAVAAALSLRVLHAERKAAPAPDTAVLGDTMGLWSLAIASFGAAMLLSAAAGLPLFTGVSSLLVLLPGLLAWAIALNRKTLQGLLFKKIEQQELVVVEEMDFRGSQRI